MNHCCVAVLVVCQCWLCCSVGCVAVLVVLQCCSVAVLQCCSVAFHCAALHQYVHGCMSERLSRRLTTPHHKTRASRSGGAQRSQHSQHSLAWSSAVRDVRGARGVRGVRGMRGVRGAPCHVMTPTCSGRCPCYPAAMPCVPTVHRTAAVMVHASCKSAGVWHQRV